MRPPSTRASTGGGGRARRGRAPGARAVPGRGPGPAGAAPGAARGANGRKAATEAVSVAGARRQALDVVLKDLERQYGKGSVIKLGDSSAAVVETHPTGVLTLDLALGGGIPQGRIVEVYGPESSGKTTLALQAAAEVQRRGGVAALIDAEHAFDPVYSRAGGVDVDELIICQPEHGEMALEVVDQLVRSSAVDLIVVDSVAALVPRAEIEGEMGMQQVGLQARLMSQALRKLTSNAAKCNCTVLFVNQLRSKIGVMYGSPEVTSGGNALKYYASVRMDIRRIAQVDGGIRSRVKVVKNKVAPPYRLAEFDILFGSGISKLGCLFDAAEAQGVVERRGAWYFFPAGGGEGAGEGEGEALRLGQGKANALEFLQERADVRAELEGRVWARLHGVEGEEEEMAVEVEAEEEARLEAAEELNGAEGGEGEGEG